MHAVVASPHAVVASPHAFEANLHVVGGCTHVAGASTYSVGASPHGVGVSRQKGCSLLSWFFFMVFHMDNLSLGQFNLWVSMSVWIRVSEII